MIDLKHFSYQTKKSIDQAFINLIIKLLNGTGLKSAAFYSPRS